MAGGNQNTNVKLKSDILSFPVDASTRIYRGTPVSVAGNGYAQNADDAAGDMFVGMAEEEVDNSSGSAGDLNIRVRRKGIYTMPYHAGCSQVFVGEHAYIKTAHSASVTYNVGIASDTTEDIILGLIVKFNSATSVDVAIITDGTKP